MDLAPAWLLLGWLLLASLVTLAVFAWDKRRSRTGGRRVPEARLLWLAFLGGAAGAWVAMRWRRHKTKHLRFRLLVPLFALLHVALLVWLAASNAASR